MPEREPQREISHIEKLLSESSVRREIAYDMGQTHHLRHKEQWLLGVVVPGQDLAILVLGEFDKGMGIKARAKHFRQVPLKKTALLYPSVMFAKTEKLAVKGGEVKHIFPLWSYPLERKPTKNLPLPLAEVTIGESQFDELPSGMKLPEFLHELGFPIKTSYVDGNPFLLERGGIIDPSGMVFHPDYFVQRSLIDDQGDLIFLGICESNPVADSAQLTPATLKNLAKQGYRTQETKSGGPRFLIRYHSYPYESETPLSILDPPISAPDWAELVICPSGMARLYVAKDQPDSNWQKMMDRLRDLFIAEMRKKGNRLLRFTQDSAYLNDYLAQKETILRDYFIIEDLGKFI